MSSPEKPQDTHPHDDDDQEINLFADPEDFYPPTPPPTTQTYLTTSGAPITLHLVGHSPLEAHHLWNGSRVVAAHFEADPSLVSQKTVLELGAGAGLPSLVAAMLGASKVVVTDFPDPDLIQNLWRNIDECTLIPTSPNSDKQNIIVADGYVWGMKPSHLLAHLQPSPESQPTPSQSQSHSEKKFDVLILADLLFRHSEHTRLLRSVETTLTVSHEARAYVVFTSYRPWLQHKDLHFFELARKRGFVVTKTFEKVMDRPLFEDDPGDEEVRKTVTGWTLAWPEAFVDGRKQMGEWPGVVMDREREEDGEGGVEK
ncbi:hypothetical protein QBC47DRAFT_372759 [Echria macrotheca]|uniref:Protein N-terminal and lysine N-methyltransferase EFM7 n=1 Tax=Echria macrotheca TaxID=438768 RepID=A0AAJ0FG22_9PEZI|nr:hypothetical protein QBC47DRAFT_372759 [Echria macrotheca]